MPYRSYAVLLNLPHSKGTPASSQGILQAALATLRGDAKAAMQASRHTENELLFGERLKHALLSCFRALIPLLTPNGQGTSVTFEI